MLARDRISLGILAGGRAERLAGADKAFLLVRGKRQLDRILGACGSGFHEILVSHNRPDPRRSEYTHLRWLPDLRDGLLGPLAGLEALLAAATTPWLLSLPVDLAWPQADITDTLLQAQGPAVLQDGDGRQPLCALWVVDEARQALAEALERGERAVHPMLDRLAMRTVSIAPRRIGNLNRSEDLDAMQ